MRKEILNRRNSLFEHCRIKKSDEIIKTLCELDCFKNAKSVYTYIDFGSEVYTRGLIEYSWQMGKSVFVPKTFPKKCEMNFYRINSFDELEKHKFGMFEPVFNGNNDKDEYFENSVHIIPGVAFSLKKDRIGYGKGYYDNYLNLHKDIMTIGICFNMQIVEDIQCDIWDHKVNFIITENGVT